MALPRQVEQDMLDIAEMESQLAAQSAPAVAPEAPAPETPPVEPPAAVAPAQPATPAATDEDWQQKYRTLKGIFDAETPRLHRQVKELTAQVGELTTKLEQKTAAPPPEAKSTVTDQDVETFGQDLIDLQRRIAKDVGAAFEGRLEALSAQNAALTQKLEQTGNKVGEMTFDQRLTRAVPDFDALNADPQWIAWLDEVDPLLRAPRRSVAQEAFDTGDVEAIAHYVNLFRQGAKPAPVDHRQAELERQVAPSRVSTGAPVTPQGKTYSVAQWGTAYNKVAQLNAQGKYDEAKTLEAELDAAANEGRVIA